MGRLAQNTLMATLWLTARSGVQAIWVILIARSLGSAGYGLFAGIAGVAASLGAISGLGFGPLMLQDAARDHSLLGVSWKRATITTVWGGILLTITLATIGPRWSDTTWQVFGGVGIAELICFPLTVVASFAFQSRERMGWGNALYALVPASNVLAVMVFAASGLPRNLDMYIGFHAAFSVAAAILAVVAVNKILSPAKARFEMARREIVEGLGFSTMRLIDTGLTSLDKTVVLRLAGSDVAGIYTSASRLAAVVTLPAISLAIAALPRLFRTGTDGATSPLVKKLFFAGLAYGCIGALAMWLFSGLLPVILGDQFSSAARAARWMAGIPMLYGLSLLGCNALMSSRRRLQRVVAQSFGLLLLPVFGILLIPHFGLAGAVIMLNVVMGCVVLLLWVLVWLSFVPGQHNQTEHGVDGR